MSAFARWLFLFFLVPLTIQGQQDGYRFGFMEKQLEQFEIPFTYQGNLIIVKARINFSHSLNLIVDTGAENLIIFDKKFIENLDLKVDREIEITGADLETKIDASICRNVLLSLENTTTVFRDIIVLQEDFLNLEERIGMPIHGLIGGKSFWNLIMTIDYIDKKIILSNNRKYQPRKSKNPYQVLDLEIKNQKPYLHCSFTDQEGETKNLKLLVDTGSSLGLLMFTDVDSSLEENDHFIKGPLGKGLSGDIYGFIARIPALNLGETDTLTQVVSYFQKLESEQHNELLNERNGLIGNPILSRYRLTIDYMSSKIYLEPNKNFDNEFKFDLSGLQLIASGERLDEFRVRSVYTNSPAAEIGIQKGDIIHRMGYWPRIALDLHWLTAKLMRKEGKRVRLVIRRNGEKLVKKLTLRDYLGM